MIKTYYIFLIFFLTLTGCTSNESVIIIDSSTKAVGDISKDTTYNGLIRFYNLKTGKLISTANYLNGLQNGENVDYAEDGKIISKANYVDGKQNGTISFYDKTGKPEFQYFSYYGLKVGESIRYRHGRPSVYQFYSFDNKLIFDINYDSVGTKKITDLQEDFFFFTIRSFSPGDNLTDKRSELFLYLPTPPNYQFKYSLVSVDEKFEVKKEIKFFPIDERWAIYELPVDIDKGTKLSLRLQIVDPNSPRNAALFKIIE